VPGRRASKPRARSPTLHDLDIKRARIYLIDHGPVVLSAFSDKAHAYAAQKLEHNGVRLVLGTGVSSVAPDRVKLSDGTEILTRTVVWGGGIQAPELATKLGLPQGRGGRIVGQADLTVDGFPRVYALGDMANVPDHDGNDLPQLGSVALQAGRWAAKNIIADAAGQPRQPFHYKDKGIMAMIGNGAAVAEMGAHHHELHGHVAFAAWLGIHAYLMSGVRERVDSFVSWGWDFLGASRSGAMLDDPDKARIDWGDEDDEDDSSAQPIA
jgi:NADH dehydrogenase